MSEFIYNVEISLQRFKMVKLVGQQWAVKVTSEVRNVGYVLAMNMVCQDQD